MSAHYQTGEAKTHHDEANLKETEPSLLMQISTQKTVAPKQQKAGEQGERKDHPAGGREARSPGLEEKGACDMGPAIFRQTS